MQRNLVVMQKGTRLLRFDVGNEDVIVTGAVGRSTKQALAPLAVAQEFVSDLMDASWTRNQAVEADLQREDQKASQPQGTEGE
jgi:hypothetical protein